VDSSGARVKVVRWQAGDRFHLTAWAVVADVVAAGGPGAIPALLNFLEEVLPMRRLQPCWYYSMQAILKLNA